MRLILLLLLAPTILFLSSCEKKENKEDISSLTSEEGEDLSLEDLILNPYDFSLVYYESEESVLEGLLKSFSDEYTDFETLSSLSDSEEEENGGFSLTNKTKVTSPKNNPYVTTNIEELTPINNGLFKEAPSFSPKSPLTTTEIEISGSLSQALGYPGGARTVTTTELAEKCLNAFKNKKALIFETREDAKNLVELLKTNFQEQNFSGTVVKLKKDGTIGGRYGLFAWDKTTAFQGKDPLVRIEYQRGSLSKNPLLSASQEKSNPSAIIIKEDDPKALAAVTQFKEQMKTKAVSVELHKQAEGYSLYLVTPLKEQVQISKIERFFHSSKKEGKLSKNSSAVRRKDGYNKVYGILNSDLIPRRSKQLEKTELLSRLIKRVEESESPRIKSLRNSPDLKSYMDELSRSRALLEAFKGKLEKNIEELETLQKSAFADGFVKSSKDLSSSQKDAAQSAYKKLLKALFDTEWLHLQKSLNDSYKALLPLIEGSHGGVKLSSSSTLGKAYAKLKDIEEELSASFQGNFVSLTAQSTADLSGILKRFPESEWQKELTQALDSYAVNFLN